MKKIFFLLFLLAQYYNCFAINKTNTHLNTNVFYNVDGTVSVIESIAINKSDMFNSKNGEERKPNFLIKFLYSNKFKILDSANINYNKIKLTDEYFYFTKTFFFNSKDSFYSKIIILDLRDSSSVEFSNRFENEFENPKKNRVNSNMLLQLIKPQILLNRNIKENEFVNRKNNNMPTSADNLSGLAMVDNYISESCNKIYFDAQLLQMPDSIQKNEIEYGIKKRNKNAGLPNFITKKEIISNNKIAGINGDIDISQLESGNYTFYIKLLQDGKTLSFAEKNFQRYTAYKDTSEPIIVKEAKQEVNDFNSNIDLSKTFVAKYNTANLVKNLNAIMPICSKFQVQGIQHILTSNNDTLLRRYFYNFWSQKNNKNPEGEWKLYADKLNYVAEKYGTSSQMGYQTDRGKVYLRFGEPATQERILNETGTLPYEIWQYDKINTTNEPLFIFCQMGAVGAEMVLLHTTLPGERNNMYWKETLFTNGVNNNSRVFYYMNTGNEMR